MDCASCGESVPDESQFCLHCGAALAPRKSASYSDNPPKYFRELKWEPYGNLNGKYYGFQIWFALKDFLDLPTRADGILTIKFKENYALLIAHSFKVTIPIRKDDFSERQTGSGKVLGYLYQYPESVLKSKCSYWLQVWLKTSDGREVYQGTGKGVTV